MSDYQQQIERHLCGAVKTRSRIFANLLLFAWDTFKRARADPDIRFWGFVEYVSSSNTFKRARADLDMSFCRVTRVIFVFKFRFLFDTIGKCCTVFFCYHGAGERSIIYKLKV